MKPPEDVRQMEIRRGERNNTFNIAILLTFLLLTLYSVAAQTGTRLDSMHTKGCNGKERKEKEYSHFIHGVQLLFRRALTANSSTRLVFVLPVQSLSVRKDLSF
jgi:hypothetical protein